jgi:eukaryotic-like serine/threonine-protein kinase
LATRERRIAGPDLLGRKETDIVIEAMTALTKLADDATVDPIRARISPAHRLGRSVSGDRGQAQPVGARRPLRPVDLRDGSGHHPRQPCSSGTALKLEAGAGAHTMLIDSADVAAIVKAAEAQGKLDVSTLRQRRHRRRPLQVHRADRQGRLRHGAADGGHGRDERLILKFLNPNVSEDEEMMKRFVHELRYSRKITHKNVIRIYDFLQIQGNLRDLHGVLPVAHARRGDRRRASRSR